METTSPLTQPLPAPDAEDAPTTGHKSARSARVELITRGERRRVWTPEQKREIVMESLGSALTPTEVARKYAITTGLLYTWRRQVLGGQMTGLVRSTPGFAQVKVVPPHLEGKRCGVGTLRRVSPLWWALGHGHHIDIPSGSHRSP
jgi:transposase-like protein